MKTIIVKLGGSVLTSKRNDLKRVNRKKLARLSGEISTAVGKGGVRVVVVHGAGPYGHVPAKKYGLRGGLTGPRQVFGVSRTRHSMEELNYMVVSSLIDKGVNAVAFQPSAGAVLDNGRIVEFPIRALRMFLDAGLTPVLYGDVAVDATKGVDVLSGDQIVPYVAEKLGADKVVIVTSYNGIFDRDPSGKGAKKLDLITSSDSGRLDGRATTGTDVTGGITGKVLELLALAEKGIPSEVIGDDAHYLERVLLGAEGVGTIIRK